MPLSTVSGILTRIGMGRLGRLGLEPAERYERARPGELVHIDVKKLGRIQGGAGHRDDRQPRHYTTRRPTAAGRRRGATVGWDYVHVAIDDCTRLAYAEVLADEKASTAVGVPAPRDRVLSPATASPSSVCMTDNGARLPLRRSTRSPAARSASATCAPGHDARRPTARPSASSAPCSAAGPTARSTAPAENAPQPLTAGSGATTITADTQPSAANHPSHRLNNLLGTYG